MTTVRDLRLLAEVTQTDLARAAKTSQPTVAAYEAGTKSPTLATVERLAASVGTEAVVVYVSPLTREDRRSIVVPGTIQLLCTRSIRIHGDPDRGLARTVDPVRDTRNQRRRGMVSRPARPMGIQSPGRKAVRKRTVVDCVATPEGHARPMEEANLTSRDFRRLKARQVKYRDCRQR